MLFPSLVILPGMLALVVSSTAVRSTSVAAPAPAPAAAPAAAVASAAATATVAPSDPGAERREGIVPPKLDPRTGEPPRGARGRLVLGYHLATPTVLVAV